MWFVVKKEFIGRVFKKNKINKNITFLPAQFSFFTVGAKTTIQSLPVHPEYKKTFVSDVMKIIQVHMKHQQPQEWNT